jgi:AcrR family transcriptional regulator
MGLREEKKERQRREILETARELFRAKGYVETRVADIVERVRISEATFFNYFPSKADVLHAFAGEQVALYRALLQHELAEETPVPHRIRDLYGTIALSIEADRAFQTDIYNHSRLFSAEGQLKEDELATYDLLIALFRVGQERGEIRRDADAVQLAEMATGIYQLTTVNWLNRWWDESAQRLPDRILSAMDVFLDGCKPKPRSKRRA